MHQILGGRGRTVRTRVAPQRMCPQWRPHQANPLGQIVAMSAAKKKESLDTSQSIYIRARPVCVTDSCACADSERDLTLDAVMYIAGSTMSAVRKETS